MLMLAPFLLQYIYSAPTLTTTTVEFTDVKNYHDLFKAMRTLYNSKNLTKDGFIIVKNSSSYDMSASSRLSVDCIVQDAYDYAKSRFVTGPNDQNPWITLDFLTSKVTLRQYSLYYTVVDRFMVDYVLYGEDYPGSWVEIDRRVVKPSDFSKFTINGNLTKAVTYPITTPLRNFSRFKIVDIGDNAASMTDTTTPINDPTKRAVTMAKLLFYGTIYPGVIKFSPIRLRRKEQMLFNFAMFSSMR